MPAQRGSEPVGFLRRHRGWIVTLAVVVVVFGLVVWAGDRDRGDGLATGDETGTEAGSASEVADPQGAPTPDAPTDRTGTTDSPVVRRDPADPMAMGDVDAPVVIVEWVDMRCPFCALFSRETFPRIVEEYIDTGVVRYELRDIVFFGEQSFDAAVAARAAGEQGLFHEYVTAVYAVAPDRGHHELPRERLVEFAREIGVPDIERFEADLDRPDLQAAVQQSTTTAGRIGVTSVPFFVVGDVAFAGAQSFDVFEQVIAQVLADADAG